MNSNDFGQVFVQSVDGQSYAQPLYLSSVNIPSEGVHNVIYVVTNHDSVYAFDADATSQTMPLWHTSFLSAGVTSVPSSDTGASDISPEIGILSTPVIDPSSNTIYVVAKTKEIGAGQTHYVYRLHALDVTTGAEKLNGPYTIADTTLTSSGGFIYNSGPSATGNGPDNVNGVIYFNALRGNQRPALALNNGVIYVGWGSNGDTEYYHGWLTGYSAQTLKPVPNTTFCTTPNSSEGGIWQGGGGPVFDANGNLYIATANGGYDGTTDWSMSLVKFAPSTNFQTPTDWYVSPASSEGNIQLPEATLSNYDLDQGSCGTLLLPPQSGLYPNLVLTGNKSGQFYLLNADNLGHQGNLPLQIIDSFDSSSGSQIYASPAFFNNTLYYNRDGKAITAVNFSKGQFSTNVTQSANTLSNRGGAHAFRPMARVTDFCGS